MSSTCAACGHPLGIGRFCTNCGAPAEPPPGDDWRTDTAERRAERTGERTGERTAERTAPPLAPREPRLPPAAVEPPPPARYPLFADELDGAPVTPAAPPTEPLLAPAPAPVPAPLTTDPPDAASDEAYHDDSAYYDTDGRSPWLWIGAALVVVALIGAGWWLFVRDDGSGTPTASGPGDGGSSTSGSPSGGAGTDVARTASAKAPRTAPPNQDVDGSTVSYDASNMLDGVADTAWRAPGDGTGLVLTFTLAEPTTLTRVGLVNGYAKTSTDAKGHSFDWYHGNRRVTAVLWLFDDGTKVKQQLKDDTALQTITVDHVLTRKVRLRLVTVSAVGAGPAGRDDTAISEVSLVGVPKA